MLSERLFNLSLIMNLKFSILSVLIFVTVDCSNTILCPNDYSAVQCEKQNVKIINKLTHSIFLDMESTLTPYVIC